MDELIKREHQYEVYEVDAYELPYEPAEGMILDARNIPFAFVESTDERYHAKCDAENLCQVPSALC